MRKKNKVLIVTLTIIGIVLLIIFLIPTNSVLEFNIGICKQNRLYEMQHVSKFNGDCTGKIEVSLTEGEAKLQILNESKDVLWEENFMAGSNKIEDIKLEEFDELYLNTITTTGDGEIEIKLEKNNFGLDKFNNFFGVK